METFIQWELEILHRIQENGTDLGAAFWSFITYFGESGIFWIAVALFLLCFKKTRLCGMTMSIALVIGLVLGNGVMKNLFARPRPYTLDPDLHLRLLWGEMTKDYSFPSGHTLASFEAAVALFLYHKKWGSAALFLAVMIAVSRIFLLVHYPSDVIVGAILGSLFALLAFSLAKKCYNALQKRYPNL